jgi:hypothetical protein
MVSGRASSGNRSEIVKMHYFWTLANFRTASVRKCDFRTASAHPKQVNSRKVNKNVYFCTFIFDVLLLSCEKKMRRYRFFVYLSSNHCMFRSGNLKSTSALPGGPDVDLLVDMLACIDFYGLVVCLL